MEPEGSPAVGELTGSALEIAIYEAMGYVPCTNVHAGEGRAYLGGRCYAPPDSPDQGGEVPLFATSLDALREVEARLRERGWHSVVSDCDFEETAPRWVWWCRWYSDQGRIVCTSEADNEALSRARAVLLALRALKGQEGGGG